MFVKTDGNNNIEAFPYSLDMFREENKNASLPKFLNNRFLETKNVFPVYPNDKPEYDDVVERIVQKSSPELIEDKWLLGWNVIEKSETQINSDFEAEKNKLLEKINELRTAHVYKTYDVVIDEAVVIPVDIRIGKPDLSNISNLVLGATIKKMNNDTSTIVFRDADDQENSLTPDEVILLGTTVSNMVTDAYEQSWAMKALVDAATDTYALRAIDTTFAEYVQA